MPDEEPLALEKDEAARAAVRLVRPGMHVALGTGSTAAYAIRALAELQRDGAGLDTVASSTASEALARKLGLPVRALAAGDEFDLMIDGADEVTPHLDLTKGRGGALFREKFLARRSKELVIVVDHTKLVERLGSRAPLPIEVVPYARPSLERILVSQGFTVARRTGPDGQSWLTDNGNELLDLKPTSPIENPRALDESLHREPGVVETGIFVGLAGRVFVGLPDNRVEEVLPPRGHRS